MNLKNLNMKLKSKHKIEKIVSNFPKSDRSSTKRRSDGARKGRKLKLPKAEIEITELPDVSYSAPPISGSDKATESMTSIRLNKRVKNVDEVATDKTSSSYENDENISEIDEDFSRFESYHISVLELAIFNSFLGRCRRVKIEGYRTKTYGNISGAESVVIIQYGESFRPHKPWWFTVDYTKDGKTIEIIFQTVIYQNNSGRICAELRMSFKEPISVKNAEDIYEEFCVVSFNNSPYKGKVLSVRVFDGCFDGIEIIDTSTFNTPLVLNETQKRFLDNYEKRVLRGGNVRYLLNGEPGTGKTESMRNLMKKLVPRVTFVLPDFNTSDDLKTIMTACEIFKPGVIVFDDIDLYIGSREAGTYSRMLGDFLVFFDGVKKRRISLLASTNDKNLVDKAAERPGRFNITLDFSYLIDEQIEEVCKIHLPKKWQIQEVYDCFTGKDKAGKDIKITGAFIANLAENLREMAEDDEEWTIDDTIFLIRESYAGFYSSQLTRGKKLGFDQNA